MSYSDRYDAARGWRLSTAESFPTVVCVIGASADENETLRGASAPWRHRYVFCGPEPYRNKSRINNDTWRCTWNVRGRHRVPSGRRYGENVFFFRARSVLGVMHAARCYEDEIRYHPGARDLCFGPSLCSARAAAVGDVGIVQIARGKSGRNHARAIHAVFVTRFQLLCNSRVTTTTCRGDRHSRVLIVLVVLFVCVYFWDSKSSFLVETVKRLTVGGTVVGRLWTPR